MSKVCCLLMHILAKATFICIFNLWVLILDPGLDRKRGRKWTHCGFHSHKIKTQSLLCQTRGPIYIRVGLRFLLTDGMTRICMSKKASFHTAISHPTRSARQSHQYTHSFHLVSAEYFDTHFTWTPFYHSALSCGYLTMWLTGLVSRQFSTHSRRK